MRRGYWSIAGLEIGLIVQLAVVALGLGAVLAASATAFIVVKWIGVGYWFGGDGPVHGSGSAVDAGSAHRPTASDTQPGVLRLLCDSRAGSVADAQDRVRVI